jgi:hypothetical protein
MTDEMRDEAMSEGAPVGEAPAGPVADAGGTGTPGPDARADWVRQLQAMIDDVATQAGPVIRDVAAKAAELAQRAAEAAAPFAAKAADVTADVGQRVVDRSRVMAADLRRGDGPAAASEGAGAAELGEDAVPDVDTPDRPAESENVTAG